MSFVDILIIIGCVALGIYVVISSIKNRKKGKTGCAHNCACCSGCAYKKNKTEKTK